MLSVLKNLSLQRWPWLLLAFSAFTLEMCALYFQHVMKLDPCVMCVYERITMIGVMFAGLIGAISPRILVMRLIAFITWAVAAFWGLQLALEHTGYQMNPSPFATCDYFPNFPNWAPLHEWLPWLFNPTGVCEDVVWTFFDYSMPQWLIVSFGIYCALFVVIAITAMLPKKSSF